jgi:ABC-type phosphate transport system substrate-binding protein
MRKLTLIFLLVAASSLIPPLARAQVIVIANAKVKVAAISRSELRDVFTGATTSLKDGTQIAPVLLKQGTTHDSFLSSYLGKNDGTLRMVWRNLVFSGQANMPKSMESEAALVEYVAHTSGAIGYISKTTPHDDVKILAIE